MSFVLYILKSVKTGRYYIGQTDDLARRLTEHNGGKSLATRGRGPWTVAYTETFATASEAKRREYEIKSKKRRSYIEWLIDGQSPGGPVV